MTKDLLDECTSAAQGQEDSAWLANEICQIIFQTGQYAAAWIGFAENDVECSVKIFAYSGQAENYLSRVKISWNENEEHGRGPAGTAIRSGTTQIIHNFLDSIDCMQPWWESAMRSGLLSLVALPFCTTSGTKGVLAVYASRFNAFPEEDVAALEQLALLLGEKLDS